MKKIFLSRGNHGSRYDEDGDMTVCSMEYVTYLAGEPHSDRPQCVDKGLAALGRELNDTMDDFSRQLLKPYLVRTLGTAEDGQAEARIYMCLDWMAREPVRTWAEALGDKRALSVLEAMPAITGSNSCIAAAEALAELMIRMGLSVKHSPTSNRCPLRTLVYATCQTQMIESYPYQAGSMVMEYSEMLCTALRDMLYKKHMDKYGYANVTSTAARANEAAAVMRRPVRDIQSSLVQLFGDLCDPGGIHDIPDPLGYEIELYDAACSREPVASHSS